MKVTYDWDTAFYWHWVVSFALCIVGLLVKVLWIGDLEVAKIIVGSIWVGAGVIALISAIYFLRLWASLPRLSTSWSSD